MVALAGRLKKGTAACRILDKIDDAGDVVAPIGAVGDAAASARNFLGGGYKAITNKAGDTVLMSKDGLRKMRFDFNNTSGDLPHVHIEQFVNGRWRDAISGRRSN